MLVHCRITPQHKIYCYPFIHLTGLRGTARVKCPVQEHNTMSLVKTQTKTGQSGGKHINHKVTTPPWYVNDKDQSCVILHCIVLTLYIKVSTAIDRNSQSILSRAPVFSSITPVGCEVQGVTVSLNLPIFYPGYCWGWVSSCSTMEFQFLTFNNCLIRWFSGKRWWN